MTANDLAEAALLMCAAAAYSVALKNTSDMIRHSLGVDRLQPAHRQAELPELQVSELTPGQVEQLRAPQHRTKSMRWRKVPWKS